MNSRKSALGLAIVLAASAPLAFSQVGGTYTQIDSPGAVWTSAWGINGAGDIVGYYSPDGSSYSAFLLQAGVFATVHEGDGLAYGINDKGQVVGSMVTAAFLYDIATRTFTTFQYPGAIYTDAYAINNAGLIVGAAYMEPIATWVGFQYDGQTFTAIEAPGATQTAPTAIKTSGESLVLAFGDVQGDVSYFFTQGKLIKLGEYRYAEPYGINDANTIVGGYLIPGTANAVGFVHRDGKFQVFRFPGAKSTVATAINDSGEVVGWFYDMSGNLHGFSWIPPAD